MSGPSEGSTWDATQPPPGNHTGPRGKTAKPMVGRSSPSNKAPDRPATPHTTTIVNGDALFHASVGEGGEQTGSRHGPLLQASRDPAGLAPASPGGLSCHATIFTSSASPAR